MNKYTTLTTNNISTIRIRAMQGENNQSIADDYGIHRSNISRIVNNMSYKHIPFPKVYAENYFVTPTGKVWSTNKHDYITISRTGLAKLSINGTRTSIDVAHLVKTLFSSRKK